MNKVHEKWYDAIMGFSLDISRDSDNFPKKVLSLFDRYFSFSRSIFFTYNESVFPNVTNRRMSSMGNYITYGIRYGPMFDYKDHVYKDDIFRWSALPTHLRGKKVVFTEDVMPLEEYEKTPYGAHMISEDMYYQAVLYFYMYDRMVGSMGLFRSRSEGRFTEDERQLLEHLAELVEANFRNYLRHTGENRFHDNFNLFFQNSRVGAVLLNQDMTVVQCNDTAREISQMFWEQYRHNQGHFLRSNYQGEPQYREIQTMVNEVGERFTGQDGNCQTVASLSGDITFNHTSFLSSNAAGLIQTWHMLIITTNTKEIPQNPDHPYNSLTQQEKRIVYYLASGMKNEQISEELHISIYTVRTHIANIYKKFEVNNKVDLLMRLQPILGEKTMQKK